jgi:hypothetical protein
MLIALGDIVSRSFDDSDRVTGNPEVALGRARRSRSRLRGLEAIFTIGLQA